MTDRTEEATQPALWDETKGANGATRPTRGPRRMRRSTPREQPSALLSEKRPLQPVDYKQLWDIEEVANYLGVPKQTIYSWRQKGYGPRGFRVGKHLRWRAATVVTWTLSLERDG